MAIDKELIALLVPGRKATPTEEKLAEPVAETLEPTAENRFDDLGGRFLMKVKIRPRVEGEPSRNLSDLGTKIAEFRDGRLHVLPAAKHDEE